jgi:hypothetical protein
MSPIRVACLCRLSESLVYVAYLNRISESPFRVAFQVACPSRLSESHGVAVSLRLRLS